MSKIDKSEPDGRHKKTKKHASPQSLNAAVKSICDIMRRSNRGH